MQDACVATMVKRLRAYASAGDDLVASSTEGLRPLSPRERKAAADSQLLESRSGVEEQQHAADSRDRLFQQLEQQFSNSSLFAEVR